MMDKYYFIMTYGCQMNIHESEKLAGILEETGYLPAQSVADADIIVLNTCCIRETAEQKIIGHIGSLKKLKKNKPALKIILCGCMTQQNGKGLEIKEKFPFVDYILGTHNIGDLRSLLSGGAGGVFVEDTDGYINDDLPVTRTSMPNAWVNIIYGCNNFCTYCIVPYVRGRERSRTMDSVKAEVERLVKEGYKEITLLGQNVNSYGHDLNDGTTFAKLLNLLADIPGKFRLRFMTSHPKDFTDDVIDAIASHDKICKHIHLPVQSGATAILKAMNRKYSREDYLALVAKIKNRIPSVGITTDIMVGFNGESERDFEDTLDLVEKCRFSGAFCFIYSKRKGTAGYNMTNIVPYEVKKERIKRLLALQNKITREENKKYIGNVFEILVEDINDRFENTYCGRTDCGRLVNFKSDADIRNKFVKVRVTRGATATLWSEVTEVE